MNRPDRFPNPRQLVVGAFEDEHDLNGALEAVKRLGFGSDSVEVLHGERDARSLDPEGERHGVAGKLTRALQAAVSYEHDHVRRHTEHLQSGGYILGVVVADDEEAKRQVGEAMRERGGDFINYYADTYIESL